MRQTDTIAYKVLSCFAYWLEYGEDDDLTKRETGLLTAFIEQATHAAPSGFHFGHYSTESENFADDFGVCDATAQVGVRVVITFVYFAN